MALTTFLLSIAHTLAGAAWFGAMFYSLTVLHPRAAVYFQKPEHFEEFIATVSHGARWRVLGAFGVLALTGFGLMILHWPAQLSPGWRILVGGKIALFLVVLGIFIYTSWWLWPARVLAMPQEIPVFQRKFRLAAGVMTTLVGLNMALGIIAHSMRP